jgi:NAD/NADP transhydrogenase alpha subunit
VLQDNQYEAAGATLVAAAEALGADVVLKVRPPSLGAEVPQLKRGGMLVSYIQPAVNEELVEALRARDMTVVGARLLICHCAPLRHNSLAPVSALRVC